MMNTLQKTQTLLLIIDENFNYCRYLEHKFSTNYNILCCTTAHKGMILAKQYSPDIVLCDAQASATKDQEIIPQLKNHTVTCHIPIIIMTEIDDLELKLQALKNKADDYFIKSCSIDELAIRMENLIHNRKCLKAYYQSAQTPEIIEKKIVGNLLITANRIKDKDISFARKLENILAKNYQNNEFNVDKIADLLFMTKRHLHRKSRALFGDSPGNLLRLYRISSAKTMLKSSKRVSDVAVDVGYTDVGYFSTVFKSVYGVTPNQYKNGF